LGLLALSKLTTLEAILFHLDGASCQEMPRVLLFFKTKLQL
jgi:hypothetical protein